MNVPLELDVAACAVGRSPKTVRRWVAEGHLKPISRRPLLLWSGEVMSLAERMATSQRASLAQNRRLGETELHGGDLSPPRRDLSV